VDRRLGMDLREIVYGDVDWIHLAQGLDQTVQVSGGVAWFKRQAPLPFIVIIIIIVRPHLTLRNYYI
jgi:hypothetical protein